MVEIRAQRPFTLYVKSVFQRPCQEYMTCLETWIIQGLFTGISSFFFSPVFSLHFPFPFCFSPSFLFLRTLLQVTMATWLPLGGFFPELGLPCSLGAFRAQSLPQSQPWTGPHMAQFQSLGWRAWRELLQPLEQKPVKDEVLMTSWHCGRRTSHLHLAQFKSRTSSPRGSELWVPSLFLEGRHVRSLVSQGPWAGGRQTGCSTWGTWAAWGRGQWTGRTGAEVSGSYSSRRGQKQVQVLVISPAKAGLLCPIMSGEGAMK